LYEVFTLLECYAALFGRKVTDVLELFDPWDGSDWLSQNIGNHLPISAAWNPRRVKTSVIVQQKPDLLFGCLILHISYSKNTEFEQVNGQLNEFLCNQEAVHYTVLIGVYESKIFCNILIDINTYVGVLSTLRCRLPYFVAYTWVL
jgi:hypothetical protein